MTAFRIFVNGEQRCVAGIEEFGVFSSILTWVSRDSKALQHLPEEMREQQSLSLQVGGLYSSGELSGKHCRWGEDDLRAGDRVEIQIEDLDEVDAPKIVDMEPAPTVSEKDRVRILCHKWGWKIIEEDGKPDGS